MPADRWSGAGSSAGAREGAGARAADGALIHDDPKLLIRGFRIQTLVVLPTG
jgi:hypothetical protein